MIARLTRSGDFARLRRHGRRRRGDAVSLVALPDETLDGPRIGYALRRSLGPAVARNRLRRRLREACRAAEADVGIPAGLYLFSGRTESMTVSFDALRVDVRQLTAPRIGHDA